MRSRKPSRNGLWRKPQTKSKLFRQPLAKTPWHWEWLALLPEKSLPKHESDFYSHLEELRSRIIVSAIVFFVASVFCFFFAKQILHFLIIPLQQRQEAILVFQKPYEAFLV